MSTQKISKYNPKEVMIYAGAFMAWVIGSGFATGQEILQFFSSYGYASYGVVALNMIGFLFLSRIIVTTGYDHQENNFDHFAYFCGNKLGAIYVWLIPVTLLLIMSVLISGAGATLFEYYGINHYIGAALMSVLVLSSYLIGFEKMVRIVSIISPIIIIFTLLVGTVTVIRDFGSFSEIGKYEPMLKATKASPSWVLSSALYLSLNFLSGGIYFTTLGAKARNRESLKLGVLLGTITLSATIAITNTAILLNAPTTTSLAIPTLYLAREISFIVGATFSIILILGIFSSCSTMMWTVCSRFFAKDIKKNKLFAIFVSIGIFLMSLFPFGRLVGVFYPLVGYVGLLFMGCVVYKSVKTFGQGKMKQASKL